VSPFVRAQLLKKTLKKQEKEYTMGFDFRCMRQNGFYLAGATNNIDSLTWSTMMG
jgi:hypothetical protein